MCPIGCAAGGSAGAGGNELERLASGEDGQPLVVRDQAGGGELGVLDTPGELAAADDLGLTVRTSPGAFPVKGLSN